MVGAGAAVFVGTFVDVLAEAGGRAGDAARASGSEPAFRRDALVSDGTSFTVAVPAVGQVTFGAFHGRAASERLSVLPTAAVFTATVGGCFGRGVPAPLAEGAAARLFAGSNPTMRAAQITLPHLRAPYRLTPHPS